MITCGLRPAVPRSGGRACVARSGLKPAARRADVGSVSIVMTVLASHSGSDQQAQAIIVWVLVALVAIATLIMLERH